MKCNNKVTIIVASILMVWLLITRYVMNKLTPTNAHKIVQLQKTIKSQQIIKDKNNHFVNNDGNDHLSSSMNLKATSPQTSSPPNFPNCKIMLNCSYDIHIFYYAWYGNPTYDNRWLHWNHPRLAHWNKRTAKRFSQERHVPENNDVGSIYYPSLGFYSSHNPSVVEDHMKQIQRAGAGVLVVSWYPPNQHDNEGRASDELIPLLLNKAAQYGLKITFHIEPYKKRSPKSVKEDLKYIINTYGEHPAFYREEKSRLPMMYIYDSYLIRPNAWSTILKKTSKNTIRGTKYDCIMIGLLVESTHQTNIKNGHWDGFYTYFAVNGMTYGSSFQNFHSMRNFADQNHLIYIPSVGPGYEDVPVRPWNRQNTRERRNGDYYKEALGNAKRNTKRFISITSFNEWHEGTNIERAIPNEKRKDSGEKYKDYGVNGEYYYIDLTKDILSPLIHD